MIWGGLHGLLQVAESLLTRGSKSKKNSKTQISDQNEKKQWSHILGICARTVLSFILVTVAWNLFPGGHAVGCLVCDLPYVPQLPVFPAPTCGKGRISWADELKLLGLLLPDGAAGGI